MPRLLHLLFLLICLGPACRAYLQLTPTGYLSIAAITNPVTVSPNGYALMMKIRIAGYHGRARFWDSGPLAGTPASFPTSGTSYTCSANGLTWALQTGSGVAPIPIEDVQPATSGTCSSTQSSSSTGWVPLDEDVTVWISVGNSGQALSMHRNTISGGHLQFYANSLLAANTFGNSAATGTAVALLYGFNARVYEIAVWSVDQGLSNGGNATFNPNQAVSNTATSLRARYDFTTGSTGDKTIPNVSSNNPGVDNLSVSGTEGVDYTWVPAPAPWAPTTAPPSTTPTATTPSPSASPAPTTPSPTSSDTPTPTPTLTPTSTPTPTPTPTLSDAPAATPTQSPPPSAVVTSSPPTTTRTCVGPPPVPGAVCVDGVWVVNGDVTIIDISVGGSPVSVNGSISISGTTTVVLDPNNPNAPIQASGGAIVDGTLVIIIGQNPSAAIEVPVVTAGGGVSGGFGSGVVRLPNGACAKASYKPIAGSQGSLIALIEPDSTKCKSKRLSTGATAGIAVGGVAIVAIIVLIVLYIVRKRGGGAGLLFQATNNEGTGAGWR